MAIRGRASCPSANVVVASMLGKILRYAFIGPLTMACDEHATSRRPPAISKSSRAKVKGDRTPVVVKRIRGIHMAEAVKR